VQVEPLRLQLQHPKDCKDTLIVNIPIHDTDEDDDEKDDHAVDEDDGEEEEEDHHDDDDEEEEEHHDDEDYEDTLDITKSFRDMCVNDWKNDWTKCKEHASYFGVETNTRGVTRIFATLSGDTTKDRKNVLATVAHGETVYGVLANKPLGELGEDA
jgi:formylglycine-generating enzyme required for sulfatase activity